MATWVVGDIHGCADELGELIRLLDLGPEDQLVSVGDLFHRGPDPVGVMELLREAGARFVLGNHERSVLRRARLDPKKADGSDRPPLRTEFANLDPEDLAGDGGRELDASPERLPEMLRFLQEHDGYFLENSSLEGAGPTADGRGWCVVHAGVIPGRNPATMEPGELTRLRRIPDPQRASRWKRRKENAGSYWYETYSGPTLVLFGHTPFKKPHAVRHGERLVALGLDTGCVYGGELSAYSPELDEMRSVAAKGTYAHA